MKKHYKQAAFISFIIIVLLVFSSCNLQSGILYILGFDTYDYDSEEIIGSLDNNSEIAIELAEMTRILSVDSTQLLTFKSARNISDKLRDPILNYLLGKSYAKYTGDVSFLDDVKEKYPGYQINTAIPEEDYENIIYQYFGGNAKLSHKSGEIFIYLDKANAYTSVTLPQKNKVVINVISCEETKMTYRLHFVNTLDSTDSKEYRAVFIKREDGTYFFRSVIQLS